MRWNTKHRILCIGVGVTFLFTGFSARLIYLQVGEHQKYTKLAADKNSRKQIIYAKRGTICDRNGELLAINVPIRMVVADCSLIKDPAALAKLAAPMLKMDEKELCQKFQGGADRKYVVIKRGVAEEDAMALRTAMQKKNMRGLDFDPSTRRVYPNGAMLCHVLGFLDYNGKGIQGVESTLEDYLSGENGYRHIEHDRTGREIAIYRGQERPARDGLSARLTIDMGLQTIVENELDSAFKTLKPEHATAIIVRPQTGEILAMASRPNFDLNEVNKAQPEQMKNRAIVDMVEPGSTFKIVVTSGSINDGFVNDKTEIFCENGKFFYGGKILKDHHGYGSLTVHDILVKSSNIGAAKLAMKMGDQKFYEYVRRFGFGEKTGILLPGEIPGLVHSPQYWDKLTITRMPMGQAVAVTPLQIVMGMSVIANGGNLMAPQIVKEISSDDGATLMKFDPVTVRRVIKPETAHYINEGLMGVVSPQGTAPLATVTNFLVGGKTGTAQKVNPKGGYMEGKYVVSFVGYMPAEKPELTCIVIIDNASVPPNLNYGGLVAAPIFSRIAEKSARHLDILPGVNNQQPIAHSGVVPENDYVKDDN
ncbi:MAG: penicillin-binding protein 2 [Chthoniobacterales bacterium]